MKSSTYARYSALTLGNLFVLMMAFLIWAGFAEVEDD